MYRISTTPGDRVDTAVPIPDALGALTFNRPHGPVAWKITDPTDPENRGRDALNARLDLVTDAVDELDTQLRRSPPGATRCPLTRKHTDGPGPTQLPAPGPGAGKCWG